MIIAFDLDGVLYPWHEIVFAFFKEQGIVPPETSFDFVWGERLFERQVAYAASLPFLYSRAGASKELVSFLRDLAGRNEIYYITSRPPEARFSTALYLERYGFPFFHNLIFTKTKDKVALFLGVDFFVEDSGPTAEKLGRFCDVILIKGAHNKPYWDKFLSFPSTIEALKFLLSLGE